MKPRQMTPERLAFPAEKILFLALLGALVAALGGAASFLDDRGPAKPAATAVVLPDRGSVGRVDAVAPDAEVRRRTAVIERAAAGPTEGRRELRLRFRCATLGHDVAGVWHHMNLLVRLEDEDGRRLGECAEPWRVSALTIPADVARIAFVADGYRRKVVPVPEASSRASDAPTEILLEPDATLRVRATNLPAAPGNEFAISARLATGVDEKGRPRLDAFARRGGPGVEAPRGELTADIEVPSGVPCGLSVSRTRTAGDEQAGFVELGSAVVTLAAGETREVVIDPLAFGVLEGQVTGVATPALKGQVLSVEGDGGVSGRAARVVLDAGGRFRVVGLSDRPVGLRLCTRGGKWPVLKGVLSDRREWRAGEGRYLVVEPDRPVFGVVPVQGGREMHRPFQVQANNPPDPHSLTATIPLFTGALLERVPLFFFVPGIGHFERSLAGERPDSDGLFRVEVPMPGGAVVVRVVGQPEHGVHLFARQLESAEPRRRVSIAGEPTGDSWRFDAMAVGEYELVINYSARQGRQSIHSERVLPGTVVVESGEQTEVTVKMPELVEIRGGIANWRDIAASLRPGWLQLEHGGRRHTVRPDELGRFDLTVLGPREGVSAVTFFNRNLVTRLETTDITWLGDDRMSVLFPSDVCERWLTAEPIEGGQLLFQVHVADTDSAARHLRPKDGNRFLVAGPRVGLDGVLVEQIRENGESLRLVRGWFRLDAGGPAEVTLARGGRWVDVQTSGGASVTLTLKPPTWWPHPRYAWASLRLEGSEPRRMWLPDDATAIIIDGTREIPVTEIGETLTVPG